MSRQNDLLAALQRKTQTLAAPKPAPSQPAASPETPSAPTAPMQPLPAKARRVGKPVQFWLHEEDRQLVRELAAWLAGQGIRPTDSMVVRAALRMSKPGAPFLEAYRKAALLDGRFKR